MIIVQRKKKELPEYNKIIKRGVTPTIQGGIDMFELTPFVRHSVNHYDPFFDFDDIEKNVFGKRGIDSFKTDIKDNGDEFLVEADLPGFEKENIHVDIDGGYMTISAERHNDTEEKDKKGNVIHSERSFGSFSRSFDIKGVKEDAISAEYKDGVLRLKLPKKAEEIPAQRRLEIQ